MATYMELQVKSELFQTMFTLGLGRLGSIQIDPMFEYEGKPSVVHRPRLDTPAVVVPSPPGPDVVITPHPNNPQQFATLEVTNAVVPLFEQEILFEIAAEEDLEQAGTSAPPTETTVTTVRYKLAVAVTTAGQPQLGFEFVSAELGPELGVVPNAPALLSSFESYLQSHPITLPTGVGSFLSQLHAVQALNTLDVGANLKTSITPSGELIAIRMEIGPSDDATGGLFAPFMQGNIQDRLAGLDWALVVHRAIVQDDLYDLVTAVLNSQLNQQVFVGPAWVEKGQWNAQDVAADVTMYAAIKDACYGFFNPFDKVDLNFDLDVVHTFDYEAEDEVLTSLKLTWSLDPAEVFYCVMSFSLIGWFVMMLETSFIQSATEKDGWPGETFTLPEVLGINFLWPATWGLVFLAGIGQALGELDVSVDSFQEVSPTNADKEYAALMHFELVPMKFVEGGVQQALRLHVKGVTGVGEGLVLKGSAESPGDLVLKSAKLEVGPETPEFGWRWKNICSVEDRRLCAEVALTLRNDAIDSLQELHVPLELTSWEILDDPLGQYKPFTKVSGMGQGEYGTVTLCIPLDGLDPDFIDDPYPFRILLRTTGGARIVTVPAVQQLTSAQQIVLVQGAKLLYQIECKPFAHVFWSTMFNLEWHIDPPPFEQPFEALWDLRLSDAAPGARLRAGLGSDLTASAVVNLDGLAGLSLLAPGEDNLGLTAIIEPGELPAPPVAQFSADDQPDEATSGTREIAGTLTVRQSAFIPAGRLEIRAPIRNMSAGRLASKQCLFVTTRGGIMAFSLQAPDRPSLLEFLQGDFRGALPWQDGVLLWANHGLQYWRAGARPQTVVQEPVVAAERYRDTVYILQPDRLIVFDKSLTPRFERTVQGPRALLRSGSRLYIEDAHGITQLTLQEDALQPTSQMQIDGARDWQLVHAIGPNRLIVKNTSGAFQTIDLHASEGALPSVEHDSEPPWPLLATPIGNFYARAIPRSGRIELYSLWQSRRLNGEEVTPGYQ